MKKFQLMMLGVATLALFSCKPNGGSSSEDPDDPEVTFKSLIDVEDYTIEDWAEVPSEFLTKIKVEGETDMDGIDSIYAYADKVYLNLLVWPRLASLPSKELVPFHIFLNADGDNKTGGYTDWFLDGNAEYLLEGFLFQGGQATIFNPAVFHWWGALGGGITDQSEKKGWFWTDPSTPHSAEDGWGADIPTGSMPVANSQALDGNKVFEIQILRSLVSSNWADKFGVGFDIEFEDASAAADAPWTMVGVLPNPTDGDGGQVFAKKADVKIDPADRQ